MILDTWRASEGLGRHTRRYVEEPDGAQRSKQARVRHRAESLGEMRVRAYSPSARQTAGLRQL
jgi:hypothetical protein